MAQALKAVQQSYPDAGPIKDSILFVSRPSIRPIIRQELKAAGVQVIINADSIEECIEQLQLNPLAMLVIDYEQGSVTVNKAMRQAQSPDKSEARPIFLIAGSSSNGLVATGAEYFVTRILIGEVSRTTLQDHLDNLMMDEWDAVSLRPKLNRVSSARRRQEFTEATAILRDLCREAPHDIRLACELVNSHIHEMQWREARAVLEALGGAASQHLRVKHLYARCLMREGLYHLAVPILEATRLINPHNVERLIDLGTALMNCDLVPEAKAAFQAALDLDQTESTAMKGIAQCRLLEGDINEALRLIRQMSGPRELASIFNNAAILSIRAGRFDDGFNLYKSALHALGTGEVATASVLFNLGVAYHKWNRDSEALDCFEKAYALDHQLDKARHNAVVMTNKISRLQSEGKAQGDGTVRSDLDGPPTTKEPSATEEFADESL